MDNIFYKLASDITFDWDIELLTKNLPILYNPADKNKLYIDPSKKAHWQEFPNTNIMFARNFYENFKVECIEISQKLKTLQSKLLKSQNSLVDDFLNHKITPHRVNIIKTIPGLDVGIHQDITRNICINIGFKNSNKWKTYINKKNDINNFWSDDLDEFIMEDGDAYLLGINRPHCVLCLDKTDLISSRYIITYTIE